MSTTTSSTRLFLLALALAACTKNVRPYAATTFPDKCGSAIQCYNQALQQLAAAREEVRATVAAALPIGAVIASADEREPPGWLKCDGSEKDVATYPMLAQALGTRYGAASPGKFRLPDYRGYFLRGWDPEQQRDTAERVPLREGASSGPHVGSVEADSVGAHTHTYRVYLGGGGTLFGRYYDEHSNCQNCVGPGASRPTEDNPTGETRPKNIAVNYLIRADTP